MSALDPAAPQGVQKVSVQRASSVAVLKGEREAVGVGEMVQDSSTPAEVQCNFVEASFAQGETPLGLVIDWAMPLPVVIRVLPHSPAAQRPEICPSLILVAVGRQRLAVGAAQDDVESLLAVRPLTVVFQAPSFVRLDSKMRLPWRRMHETRSGRLAMSPSSRLSSPSQVNRDTAGNEPLECISSPSAPTTPLRRTRVKVLSGCLLHGQDLTDVRAQQHNHDKATPVLPAIQTDNRGGMSRSSSWSGNTTKGFWRDAPSRQVGGQHRRRLAIAQSLPPQCDRCYSHLVMEPRPLGPGPPALWPLGHESEYICRVSDLELAFRLREAYESGYRGSKRATMSEFEAQRSAAQNSVRSRQVGRADMISCDLCGTYLADAVCPGPFYYCKRCKKAGNRFELCVSCHSLEILQGEGKHSGEGLHPHFIYCEHLSLARSEDLRCIYPGVGHLRRIFCDYCGHVLPTRSEEGCMVYACQQCPENLGIRFELCDPCACALRERGYEDMYRRYGDMIAAWR